MLLCASLIPLTAARKIVGGPFVVNVTSRSATVVWIVESDQVTLLPSGASIELQ